MSTVSNYLYEIERLLPELRRGDATEATVAALELAAYGLADARVELEPAEWQQEATRVRVVLRELRQLKRQGRDIGAADTALRAALGDGAPSPGGVSHNDLARIVTSVQGLRPGVTEEGLARAIARELGHEAHSGNGKAGASELAEVVEALQIVAHQMKGMRPAFGSSGPSNIADAPNRELGVVTTTGQAKIATEATVATLLDALTKPRDSVRGTATVATGSFATVVSYTPTTAIVVTGVSGDFAALTNIAYRLQVVVGGTVKYEEALNQNANSWTPIEVDVPASTAVEVKVRHGEVADQTGTGTIAWREA